MAVKSRLKLIESKKGVFLDISFGGKPQPNSVTLSPVGDLKHRPSKLPFPLPDRCAHTVVITHVLEFLDPTQFFDFWDEVHRVIRPEGICYVSGPYGGDESQGWISDPTHRTRVTEQSFAWLDPRTPMHAAHPSVGRKIPLPWWTLAIARVPGTYGSFSYNATLQAKPKAKK